MDAKWLLRQYLLHFKAMLLDMNTDPVLQKNVIFRNLHTNERCFIIGSGHSILEQDLTVLKDEIVITQNHFHAHEKIGIINPAYHVVVPKYQPKEYDKDWVVWLRSMDERLPPETVLFFAKNTKYLVDAKALFDGRAYYMKHGYRPSVVRKAPIDITRTIMAIPTVLTQCLAVAIYMGFMEVYLVGFDLDQVCRMNNRNHLRFYGLSPITSNKADIEIETKLWISGQDWINYWSIWRQCHLLKDTAEKKGIRIINSTRGGLLDMFERRKLEDVLSPKTTGP